jgi:hypothetical protein
MRPEWIKEAEEFLTREEESKGQDFFDRDKVVSIMVGFACKKIAEIWLEKGKIKS